MNDWFFDFNQKWMSGRHSNERTGTGYKKAPSQRNFPSSLKKTRAINSCVVWYGQRQYQTPGIMNFHPLFWFLGT